MKEMEDRGDPSNGFSSRLELVSEVAEDLHKLPGSLQSRVLRGGFWIFSLRIVNRLLQLASTVVLARLLSPTDFGLLGIALLTRASLDTFTRTGFGQALVQRRDAVEEYLDAAWTVQALRGLALAAAVYLLAPLSASFFGDPGASDVIRGIALAMLLQGFTNIGTVYLDRNLEFRKQFVLEVSGTIGEVLVGVAAAFALRSVWALVLAFVARYLVRTVVSYLVHPYRPRFRWDTQKSLELYRYGRWVFASAVVAFLATQGDDLFIGKLLGATALGYYQMAFRISNLMATEITTVVTRVTFPAFARLQGHVPKLREGFAQTFDATLAVTLPLAGAIWVLAPAGVELLLGPDWLPAVGALRVLTVAGLLRSLIGTSTPLFRGVGEPQWDFWVTLIRVAGMAAVIYPLTTRYGMTGTAASVLLGLVATVPVWVRRVGRILKQPVGRALGRSWLTAFSVLLMVGAMLAVEARARVGPLGAMLLSAAVGSGVYGGSLAVFRPDLKVQWVRLLRRGR